MLWYFLLLFKTLKILVHLKYWHDFHAARASCVQHTDYRWQNGEVQFLLGHMKNLSCLPETVLSGGSGLVLVLVGEGSRDESEPSNRACSRGEAGASRGDNRFSRIILSIGDVGDKGLEIELRDSWLSLLYSGFVEVLGPIFLEFPPSNLNLVGSLWSSWLDFLAWPSGDLTLMTVINGFFPDFFKSSSTLSKSRWREERRLARECRKHWSSKNFCLSPSFSLQS